jgi:hypothetical protein
MTKTTSIIPETRFPLRDFYRGRPHGAFEEGDKVLGIDISFGVVNKDAFFPGGIQFHIKDKFRALAFLFLGIRRNRQFDGLVHFEDLGGGDCHEKHKQHQQNINHRSHLELRFVAVA